MVRSPSSSAGATVRSRIACPSRKGGITRYVSSAREQKSSTARGCFRWHNPRVEAGALLFMPEPTGHFQTFRKKLARQRLGRWTYDTESWKNTRVTGTLGGRVGIGSCVWCPPARRSLVCCRRALLDVERDKREEGRLDIHPPTISRCAPSARPRCRRSP